MVEIMIIATPKYGKMIAPCFETATDFLIAVAQDNRIILSRQVACAGCKGFSRISLLNENSVNVLICSGIKAFYQNLLLASDIKVISSVNLEAEKAIELFLAGNLGSTQADDDEISRPLVPLDDLVCWSKDILSAKGFRVRTGLDDMPFPIDFLAEINCPRCGKSIMVAVCCGAHAYKTEYELREFDRVSRTREFHSRVYVHPYSESIGALCRDLGIELIDPFADRNERDACHPGAIPFLKIPIIGHEMAFS
jgi:predicted Fe-Mo cluster-binding NifX family protein